MVFTARVNPVTKETEWVVRDDDYEFEEEVAASGYGDMLFDDERNQKYRASIRRAVQRHVSDSTSVLDIGTGTGLLALLSAEAGADRVTACEGFLPMARVAKETVAWSQYANRINVVGKRSDELVVGDNNDMPARADIVVHEILDTELLGEGVIPSMRDAYRRLLKPGAASIPAGATLFAQVVESLILWSQHRPPPLPMCRHPATCPGLPQALSVQANTIPDMRVLTEPFAVFSFVFSDPPPEEGRETRLNIEAAQVGTAHAVLCWWELRLDECTTLSTAPHWAVGDGGETEWRDHWMQAVYFLPQETEVAPGASLLCAAAHDDFSVWFCVHDASSASSVLEEPRCTCGMHMLWGPTRLGALNDSRRMTTLKMGVAEALRSAGLESRGLPCLSLSDGSVPALVAAELGATGKAMRYQVNIYSLLSHTAVEDSDGSRRLLDSLLVENNCLHVLPKTASSVTAADFGGRQIGLLLSEPYFTSSLLPWHNLYFWYARTSMDHLLADDAVIMPSCGRLMAVAVELKDLWKSHAPIESVCGFDLSAFQKLADAGNGRHGGIFPYTMSEYEYDELTHPTPVATFDFTGLVHDVESTASVNAIRDGQLNGIILWMDYELSLNHTLSTSPRFAPYQTQAVYMVRSPVDINATDKVGVKAAFSAASGNIQFTFSKNSEAFA